MDGLDIKPALYTASRDVIEGRVAVNLLLSSLVWHGSQASEYFLLADSAFLMKPGALEPLLQEFKKKGDGEKLLRLKDAKVNNVAGTLYTRGRPLESMAEYLYWMAPFSDVADLMVYFEHLHRSHVKADTSEERFVRQDLHEAAGKAVQRNPLAMITTNMTVANEFFPTNPYERGQLFWTKTATKGSFIVIKFLKLQTVKAIRIITGKDIYATDLITKAVLEEANDVTGINCGQFKEIADFSSGHVKITFPSSGIKRWKTSCLRIRMIEDEGHWAGIRMIQIFT